MNPPPLESLNFLAEILQGVAFPYKAADGRVSHMLINHHVQNIFAALQPKPEPQITSPEVDKPKEPSVE